MRTLHKENAEDYKNELYEFCMDNTRMLLSGTLGWDRIEKLRGIGFDFNYYIDQLIKERGGQSDINTKGGKKG